MKKGFLFGGLLACFACDVGAITKIDFAPHFEGDSVNTYDWVNLPGWTATHADGFFTLDSRAATFSGNTTTIEFNYPVAWLKVDAVVLNDGAAFSFDMTALDINGQPMYTQPAGGDWGEAQTYVSSSVSAGTRFERFPTYLVTITCDMPFVIDALHINWLHEANGDPTEPTGWRDFAIEDPILAAQTVPEFGSTAFMLVIGLIGLSRLQRKQRGQK